MNTNYSGVKFSLTKPNRNPMNARRKPWARLTCGVLIMVFGIFPLSASSSDDSNSDGNSNGDTSSRRACVPSIGIPYSSMTEDGDIFSGTVQIDHFEADGDQLKAIGALRKGRRSRATEFPVEVVQSSCDILELKVGPPKQPRSINRLGLLTPLTIVESLPGSELRRGDFCNISLAKNNLELADLLNEQEKIDAGVLGSCPWYKQIECAFAVNACRTICTLFTPASSACRNCFNDLNAGSCISCYVP